MRRIGQRYLETLRQASNLKTSLAKARLLYRVLYANENPFPEHDWLKGSVCDLADLIDLVAVPRSAFDKAAKDLSNSIDSAVSVLENSAAIYLTDKIFSMLGLADVIQTQRIPEAKKRELKNTQTRRIANALIFHERIAKHYEGIPPIRQLFHQYGQTAQQAALEAWQKILDINYWPIFATARDIVNDLDAETAFKTLDRLAIQSGKIREKGLLYENDLTGHIFQAPNPA